MKFKAFLITISILCLTNFTSFSQLKKLTNYVDPFIGTDGFGHTFPGATLPFGMVQLSPDTRINGWENCSGYHSSNPTIIGFSHTHLSGTGASDYGDIMFMATDGQQMMPGDESNPAEGYRSKFNIESEKAKPGYYKVMLEDHGIQAEMTATTRCGLQKYVFPPMEEPTIILDLIHGISDKVTDSEISIINDHTVSGFRRSGGWAKDHIVFFYAEFSVPFLESGITDKDGHKLPLKHYQNTEGLKAFFTFKLRNYDPVLVRVGISTVSVENAKMNLKAEINDWNFDKIKNDAISKWEEELRRIVVEGKSKKDKVNFYTALYHCMISPNIMSDVDGRYRGMDGNIHKMDRGNMYTIFSLWDTFRALHPLYTVIDPLRAQEFVRALIRKYNESGMLPVWELASNETNCMIGYHSVPVITDAYMKGLRDFNIDLAFEAMKKSASSNHLGMEYYKKYGYIPADKENEAVSKTLEYAYDDWCIAIMAKEMGKEDDYNYFLRRSKNYQNLYDKESGFMRGKKNANWYSPFDPFEVSGIYTEANAWQYSWFAPHDIEGLSELMGGKKAFTSRLESVFNTRSDLSGRSQPDISGLIGQYAHGNEPSHHMIYLFNHTYDEGRSAELVNQVMNEFYTNDRNGLIGNEDCGQMSAWYVFSALGFYPVCPGSNVYELGSPLFDKIILNKNYGNTFTITADSLTTENIYIRESYLDGKLLDRALNHADLTKGGTLTFKMTGDIDEMNVSINESSDTLKAVIVPFLKSGEKAFSDSCRIEMYSYTEDATIYYTIDGSEPDHNSNIYSNPFYIYESTTLNFKAVKRGFTESYTVSAGFIKIPYKKSISYENPYSHLYTAGGKNGLIDGIHGIPEVFGGWQGFYGVDLDAVVDLGAVRTINRIEVSFLQQYASWIWLPEQVEYFISEDGEKFERLFNANAPYSDNEPGSFIYSFSKVMNDTMARYIKVKAKNKGICPDWHPGSGEKAWIFVDEITVE